MNSKTSHARTQVHAAKITFTVMVCSDVKHGSIFLMGPDGLKGPHCPLFFSPALTPPLTAVLLSSVSRPWIRNTRRTEKLRVACCRGSTLKTTGSRFQNTSITVIRDNPIES